MSIYCADEELIVTVYFTLRGYTDAAVRRKVEGIVREYPHLLSASGKWNIIEVDWWLDHLSLAHDAVSELIGCSALDVAIAEEVSGRPGEVVNAVLTILHHQITDRILHTLAQVIRYRINYHFRTESQSSDNTSS